MDTEYNNPIKIDGNESSFESGATRYTKDGKGCFDLIPSDILSEILQREKFYEPKTAIEIFTAGFNAIAFDNPEYLIDIILNLSMVYYTMNYNASINKTTTVDDNMLLTNYITNDVTNTSTVPIIDVAVPYTLLDLAKHYENGAKLYGVDNWKKGIPCYSFFDSGMRHLCQFLIGKDDENHCISAIWNFIGYIWTYRNKPTLRMDKCGRPDFKEFTDKE